MLRLIIAGGRDFSDYELLCKTIDRQIRAQPCIEVVCGTKRKDDNDNIGADQLGERYAKERGYVIHYREADWKTYGRSAGPIRNAEMGDIGNALSLFWDGKSPGSKNMLSIAQQRGIPYKVTYY